MKILRDIQKLIFTSYLSVLVNKWKIDGKNVTEQAQVLFPDGIIAIDSSAKTILSEFQAENYAQIVSNSKQLIGAYDLKDGDVFIGRNRNYFLFRAGSVSQKSDQFTIVCNNLKITANSIVFNDIPITTIAGQICINGKAIAVVGGDINTGTSKITGSGQ